MESSDEQFCLKWNDYQNCIKSTFKVCNEHKDSILPSSKCLKFKKGSKPVFVNYKLDFMYKMQPKFL